VFTARYALSPYIKQTHSVFKGLTWWITKHLDFFEAVFEDEQYVEIMRHYGLTAFRLFAAGTETSRNETWFFNSPTSRYLLQRYYGWGAVPYYLYSSYPRLPAFRTLIIRARTVSLHTRNADVFCHYIGKVNTDGTRELIWVSFSVTNKVIWKRT
jgi:hypothetical protein